MASKTSSKSRGGRRTPAKSTKKAASRPTKSRRAKVGDAGCGQSAGDAEVTLDRRRGERRGADSDTSAAPKLERRQKVNRRRQIDPTTCERDYTDHEVEFMNALDDYKRKSGRMFPTCSEVLEVLRGLGYVRVSSADLAAQPLDNSNAASAKPMPSDWSPAATD